MRYSFYEIVRKTGGPSLWEKLAEDISMEGWQFNWATYCPVLESRLKQYIQERQRSAPPDGRHHLLVIDGGYWDIRINSIQVSRNRVSFYSYCAYCLY